MVIITIIQNNTFIKSYMCYNTRHYDKNI
jgi:hypothetical protein